MPVRAIDHIVITVSSIAASLPFYRDTLGLEVEGDVGESLVTLRAGDQLVRLQVPCRPSDLMATRPLAGSSDLCFCTDESLELVRDRWERLGAPLVCGPVQKNGAHGAMTSIYGRDPDGSLVEVCRYGSEQG